MLETLGFTAEEALLYETVVDHPGLHAGALALAIASSPAKTRRLLDRLQSAGLVSATPGSPQGHVAAPPELALEVLVLRRQEELQAIRADAARLQGRFQAALPERGRTEHIEVVHGVPAVMQRFAQLQRAAEHEVLGFDVPPYGGDPPDAPMTPDTNPIEVESFSRGVRFRIIYDRTALEFPGMYETITDLANAGEESRIFDGIPMKLAIADEKMALLPLTMEDMTSGALVVNARPLVRSLRMLFELVWERAAPLGGVAADGSFTEDETRCIALLGAGLKDAAAARQLGISQRTLERRVQAILEILGASTRFQAGAMAARRGLV